MAPDKLNDAIRRQLDALIEIFDDQRRPDDERYYVSSALPAQIEEARRVLALEPVIAEPAEPEWSAHKDAPESFARIRDLVNGCPITQSALYDINLLPEQTSHDPIRWCYTIAVAEHINLAKERAKPASAETAAEAFAALTDDQRSDLTANYCKHCWQPDPRCQCGNDE